MTAKVRTFDHPLVQAKLARIRDKRTPSQDFRRLLSETASLMAYEVLAEVRSRRVTVKTPLAGAPSKVLDQPIACIAILRAGLGLAEGVSAVAPEARTGHIGIYRNEANLDPVRYYVRLPEDLDKSFVVLVDPMLATGGSAVEALDILKAAGAKTLRFMALIAAKQGIERVHQKHPDVPIYVAHVDPVLNEKGYIVPGLGDAGDRIFGT